MLFEKILRISPHKILIIIKKHLPIALLTECQSEGKPINYERLEFLGDAMLSSVIAAHLFNKAPDGDEGYLTKMRSKIVSREHLNELGKDLNLIQFIESKVPVQSFWRKHSWKYFRIT